MSFTIVPSKRFLKAAKKYARGRKDILVSAEEAIDLLSVHDGRSIYLLNERWKDHALKGDKKGIRELHLSMDDLLLYRIDHEESVVELLDIVNHEELRKKR